MSSACDVLIPVVLAARRSRKGETTDRPLMRVRVSDDHPDDLGDTRLDRAIAPLAARGFFEAGEEAKSATRALGLRPQTPPVQYAGATEWPPFITHIANPGDVEFMADADTTISAELGIAIAMLAFLSQAQIGTVIATGGVSAEIDGRPAVDPVTLLETKLALIQFNLRTVGTEWPRPIRLFLPHTEGGEEVEKRHADIFADLRGDGVEIHAVGSLRDVADILGIHHLAETPKQRQEWRQLQADRRRTRRNRLAALGLGVGIAAAGIGMTWAVTRPLPLTLADMPGISAADMPARALPNPFDQANPHVLLQCHEEGGMQVVRAGELLLLRVRNETDAMPVRLAFVTVGEKVGVGVTPAEMMPSWSGRPNGGDLPIVQAMPDNPTPNVVPDEIRMAVVGTRWPWHLDAELLRRNILAAMDKEPEGQKLDAAMARLRNLVDGYLPLMSYRLRPARDPICNQVPP